MRDILHQLGIDERSSGTFSGEWLNESEPKWLTSYSPTDNVELARVAITTESHYDRVVEEAQTTFKKWREIPAPKRGAVIREIAEALRRLKSQLARLITLECGKILPEAEGEVQEAIDIADFAVGLSRQLTGLSMHSERPKHRMYEQWHPLGPVAVITAFNFPCAVWAWNAFIAAVCGDIVVWKASEETPLTALALTKICRTVTTKAGCPGLFSLVTGDGPSLGKKMAQDHRFPLVSATGSCEMGRSVAQAVSARLGKSLLELGGNNAVIVLADADLELAARSVFFGAVGTAGQRCTSTRRVLIDRTVQDAFLKRLTSLYEQTKIGNPLEPQTLVGPLINQRAVTGYLKAVQRIPQEGGQIIYGGKAQGGNYVLPTIVLAHRQMPLVREETFAPILYVLPVASLSEAIEINNEVPQGLSSALFSKNVQASEQFLSAVGSDCGIANVNIGTSGAEIGGAFGGEKDTGGGREAGSDSWKSYMRRQTSTINWGDELPLAQGIKFGEGIK